MIASVHLYMEEPSAASSRGKSAPSLRGGAAYHQPVLVAEVLAALQPAPGKLILDGTLGGGGHAEAILAAGAQVLGLDQDPAAIAFASERLSGAGEQFRAVRSSYGRIGEVLDGLGVAQIDGALLDLGVSSHQLDTPERGFSFQRDGALDMRMDPAGPVTAADLVNTWDAVELERIFRELGEEPAARRIAAHLVRERAAQPFSTTLQLAAAIEKIVPRHSKTHPATRTFQALRIAVNRELDLLREALELFAARLVPGGRLAVIAFHSLEDRIVKQFFKSRSAETIDRPEWPAPRPNPERLFRKVTGKAISATPEEARANARARSAKLRVVEKL